jgi:hypothetical protein
MWLNPKSVPIRFSIFIIILGEEISGWKTKLFKCPVISEKDDGK